MARNSNRRYTSPLRRGLTFGALGFVLALLVSFPSREATEQLSVLAAIAALFVVIATGVFFDMVGVAAAAGREEPLNAMAARRVRGARHARRLVRHADRVSAVCADVVGDIAGTVSGAAGVAIVLRFMIGASGLTGSRVVMDSIMVAAVASLTVGGKAASKVYALRQPTKILLVVGRVLWWLETYLHLRLLRDTDARRR